MTKRAESEAIILARLQASPGRIVLREDLRRVTTLHRNEFKAVMKSLCLRGLAKRCWTEAKHELGWRVGDTLPAAQRWTKGMGGAPLALGALPVKVFVPYRQPAAWDHVLRLVAERRVPARSRADDDFTGG